jgi:translation initiation factor IF-1
MSSRNLRGGKSFKKGKKPAFENAAKFQSKEEDQDYARVTKILGDRRATCFCNDGKERVGKFRGAICRGPKKQIIEAGDIVLISLREFGKVESESESESEDSQDDAKEELDQLTLKKPGPCDILFKYDRADWRAIGKEEGTHPELFAKKSEKQEITNDDIFEYGEEVEVKDQEKMNDIDEDAIDAI